MPNLSSETIGDFGVPGVTIEQTVTNRYDPYRGIDLRQSIIEENVCIAIEASRPTKTEIETNSNLSDYLNPDYPNRMIYTDGVFRDITLYPKDTSGQIGQYYDEVTPDFEFTNSVRLLHQIQAVCADGTRVLIADANIDHYAGDTIQMYNFLYTSGTEACLTLDLINTDLLYNTDGDGRPSLGMASTKDLNAEQEYFSIDVPAFDLEVIKKTNLINNGRGRMVEKAQYFPEALGANSYKPDGGWDYVSYDGAINYNSWATDDTLVFTDDSGIPQTNDTLGETYGFAGALPYVHHTDHEEYEIGDSGQQSTAMATIREPIEWAKWIRSDECYSNGKCLQFQASQAWGNTSNMITHDYLGLVSYTVKKRIVDDNTTCGRSGTFSATRATLSAATAAAQSKCAAAGGESGACTCETYQTTMYETANTEADVGAFIGQYNNHEYRTNNQFQKLSIPGGLSPYASLKVSFWMKTLSSATYYFWDLDDEGRAISEFDQQGPIGFGGDATSTRLIPQSSISQGENAVEVGVVKYIPNSGALYFPTTNNSYFNPRAGYPSINKGVDKDNNQVPLDNGALFGMQRFSNNRYDKWQRFEYTFSLNDFHGSNDFISSLYFIVQTSAGVGEKFRGTVLLDNFKVEESYDFIPDCDVRKKKAPNDYGSDLTKYYDNIINPVEYQDSTAPLEAQFYFYPRYFRDDLLDGVERPIIHNDFRNGMFYIYDVNWGDDSINEFTDEPKMINEETAVYHTYEKAGVYQITGTMLRAKPNLEYEPIGIVNNRKFVLTINVNEGLDEDFTYFGSDGFSFIPYKSTLPTVGGYSEQGTYYKTITRQLGIISDDVIVDTVFENLGDRLKTEAALNTMDSKYFDYFTTLSEFDKPRYSAEIPEEIDVSEQLLLTIDFPQYWQEFDITQDGEIGIIDSYFWEIYGRPDIAEEVQRIVFNQTPYPPSAGNLQVSPDNYTHPDIPAGSLIYRGDVTLSEQLGKSFGNADLTNIRFFSKPLPMWYMLGFFQNNRVEYGGTGINEDEHPIEQHPGNPGAINYWKNIISEGVDIVQSREVLNNRGFVNTTLEQDFLPDVNGNVPYYPVLPKYNTDGRVMVDSYPRINDSEKVPFPSSGPITNELFNDDSLRIHINKNTVESNVFDDNSGNSNYGFAYSDYKPDFDSETLKPSERKNTDVVRTTRQNGAY